MLGFAGQTVLFLMSFIRVWRTSKIASSPLNKAWFSLSLQVTGVLTVTMGCLAIFEAQQLAFFNVENKTRVISTTILFSAYLLAQLIYLYMILNIRLDFRLSTKVTEEGHELLVGLDDYR